MGRRAARPFRYPASLTALLVLWNLGLIFQWGTHLIPARGPISWREVAYNQVAVVPAEAAGTVEKLTSSGPRKTHGPHPRTGRREAASGRLSPEGNRVSGMSATVRTAALTKVPVLRITPPSRWWVVPFGELWAYRELLYFLVWRDIKIRYKQTAIGAAWAVLQPFLTMLVFSLFFGKLAHIPSEGLPYPIFYYSALFPWMYFGALQSATNTIVENRRLITKVYFPRLPQPLSSVLSGLVDFGVSFLMFLAMMLYFGISPTAALWLPLFLLLAILTALGVGLWLSALNAIY